MIKICLTGSIATGKTTVSDIMKELGAIIIDTDLIVHLSYKSPSLMFEKIKEVFGEEFVTDNEINRKKLGEYVFKNKNQLENLNKIVHPFVQNEVKNITQKYVEIEKSNHKSFLMVYVIPLFFETNSNYNVDYIIVTSCPEDTQLKRLINRNGFSEEEAKRRINSQISSQEKAKRADFVINTEKSLQDLKISIENLLKKWEWEPFYEKN